MSGRPDDQQGRFIPSLLIGAGAWWVWQNTGPVMLGSEINPIPAIAAGFVCMSGFVVVANTLSAIGDFFDWLEAQQTTGLKGTSGLIKSLRELGKDLKRRGWGPYWGMWKGKEVISDYESITLTVGTSGSGKSSRVVIPTALSITDSAAHTDFKGSLTCQLAQAMRARGDYVRILNYGNLFTETLGPSDCYNPMHIITDCFKRPGGLLEVSEILEEKPLKSTLNPKVSRTTATILTSAMDHARWWKPLLCFAVCFMAKTQQWATSLYC